MSSDYSKLVEALRSASTVSTAWGKLMQDAATAIEVLEAAQPHWVSVDERLPEVGNTVLVFDEWRRFSICKLDKEYKWVRQGGGWLDTPFVRYWMPIEPPQEVQDVKSNG